MLGLVLITIGMVVGGAVESSNIGLALWAWHAWHHKDTSGDKSTVEAGSAVTAAGSILWGIAERQAVRTTATVVASYLGLGLIGTGVLIVG